jgi:para-nitrobenzyl esterase
VTPVRTIAVLLAGVLLLAACGRGVGETPVTLGPPPAPNQNQGRPADPSVAQTTTGAVRGLVAVDHRLFAGIPYAAAPVGALRWQLPAPAPAWQGVRDATKPGLRCVQDDSDEGDFGRTVSEDCLFLNVWTPNHPGESTDGKKPVMVWIHGGAFLNGAGDIYDARRLTTQGDIIVVTLNYRLGALGFLAHPSLAHNGEAGNYGLADQQAALRWVHDNIANFGGDPDKVTIAGESAGGMSVCDHLVAPGSVGLFRAAIIQSGPCQAQADRPTAERVSMDYATAVGCPDVATAGDCLRALPATKLVKAPWYYNVGADSLTGPVTGTDELPIDPMAAFAEGRAARVPLLIGTTHDEFTLFVALQYIRTGSPTQYPQVLDEAFGAQATQVAAHYPVDRYGGSAPLAYAATVTDGDFACPADHIAAALTRAAPVFAYEFNDPGAPAPDALRHVPFPVGASHSLELRYLFDIADTPPLDPAQRLLSDEMIGYWSQFVSAGAPRASGAPEWPAIGTDVGAGQRMSLRPNGSRTITDFDAAHQCPFWASLPPR